jgi:pyrroline-5-carboxylate reductase
MTFDDITNRGLVMLGCGKMGSAMLKGWLAQGLPAKSIWVVDPYPSDWVKDQGVHINADLPADPAIALIAVKPQMMADALPKLRGFGSGTLILSVAAGTPISTYQDALGAGTRIIRAMPNTPAAIGKGISAIIGNSMASEADLDLADVLLSAVGQVVRLETEDQIDDRCRGRRAG